MISPMLREFFEPKDVLPANVLAFTSFSGPILVRPIESLVAAHAQMKHVLPAFETSTHCPCPEHEEVASPQVSWLSWQVEMDEIGWFGNGEGMGDCWGSLFRMGIWRVGDHGEVNRPLSMALWMTARRESAATRYCSLPLPNARWISPRPLSSNAPNRPEVESRFDKIQQGRHFGHESPGGNRRHGENVE
jgi:hypothetical protein